ncbi:MAG: hypothetical protein IPN74_17905 [Haliscomenobacter sp.]|nr:hypothetical protein [Haliscomenobacter sp.]
MIAARGRNPAGALTLDHLTDFSIAYYRRLLEKIYGKGRERKTKITALDSIQATEVVIANNSKLYVNRTDAAPSAMR